MMRVAQAVLPQMRAAGGGRIINMGSLAGKEGLAQLTAYSAASAGVIAFTKALAREVVADNIFVNCVAPGPIDTGMIRGLGNEAVRQMIGDSPMKRLGTAEEVCTPDRVVVFGCEPIQRGCRLRHVGRPSEILRGIGCGSWVTATRCIAGVTGLKTVAR